MNYTFISTRFSSDLKVNVNFVLVTLTGSCWHDVIVTMNYTFISTRFSSDLKVNVNFVLKFSSIISKQTDPVKDNLLYTNKSILDIYREISDV